MGNILKFSSVIVFMLIFSLETSAQENYTSIKLNQRGKVVEYDQNLKSYIHGLDSEEKLKFLRKKYFVLKYDIRSRDLDLNAYLSEMKIAAPNLPASLNSSDTTITEDNNKLITWIEKYDTEYLGLINYILNSINSNAYHKQENNRK